MMPTASQREGIHGGRRDRMVALVAAAAALISHRVWK